MKKSICLIGLATGLVLPAGASLYSFGTLDSQLALGPIPDNDTLGLTESFTAAGLGPSIGDLTLTIELQGGLASDLSGYLRLGDTASSPYYSLDSVIQNQTLSDSSPTTVVLNFSTPTYGIDLASAFSGQNPNNTWTLFLADTTPGDQTTLNGWSLDIMAVPEPSVNVALIVFGALFLGGRHWLGSRSKHLRNDVGA